MTIETMKTSLLHESGREMVMLGGDVYEQRQKGDITYEFKWVNGEQVMLMYKRVLGKNTQAFMLELKDAHLFAKSDGYATQRLLSETCHHAAKALNSEHDKSTITRIIDIILDGVPILLKMPPEPKAIEIANRPSSGNDELSIKMDGKTVIETVI